MRGSNGMCVCVRVRAIVEDEVSVYNVQFYYELYDDENLK